MKKKLTGIILGAVALSVLLTGCIEDRASDTVSENLSLDADNFKIERTIIFYNGITGEYVMKIEGLCSIADEGNQLEVTCKEGKDAYTKDFLGLSDNVTYFVQQTENANVDPYHRKIYFRPETILPDIELDLSSDDK